MRAEADVYFPGSTIVIVEPVDLKWHNSDLAYDVNNDTQVSPLDALTLSIGSPLPRAVEILGQRQPTYNSRNANF